MIKMEGKNMVLRKHIVKKGIKDIFLPNLFIYILLLKIQKVSNI
jgi:hypothetical protein